MTICKLGSTNSASPQGGSKCGDFKQAMKQAFKLDRYSIPKIEEGEQVEHVSQHWKSYLQVLLEEEHSCD